MTTLADLLDAPERALLARCQACGHEGRIELYQLIQRFGPDRSLHRLQNRCRCTACGAKQAALSPFPAPEA